MNFILLLQNKLIMNKPYRNIHIGELASARKYGQKHSEAQIMKTHRPLKWKMVALVELGRQVVSQKQFNF